VTLQVDDPDRAVLPAAIVAPLLVPRIVHPVSDARAVGRNLALITARQLQRFLDASLGGPSPETRRRVLRPGPAPLSEEHGLAIGRPSLNRIGAGVPGQTLRLASFGGNDVDVGVAGVFGAEGDPLPVWREVRVRGLALEAGQSARQAPGSLDDPDVVGRCETHLRGAHPP